MPWSGGVYTRTNGVFSGTLVWTQDAAAGTNITTGHHDTHDQDLATGLNNCVTVDGQNQINATFVPKVDASFSLGSSSQRWQQGYLSVGLSLYNGGTNAVTISAAALTGSRAVTFPDAAGNVVIDTAAQTLTNKTLTSPTINAASLTGVLAVSSGAVNETSATIASASTVNIGAASANYLQVTGTTTITAFDTIQAGTERTLKFGGILTLTNNATSLILPGGANITTAAGDAALFRSEGSGNWRCVAYTKANGQAVAGVTSIADATNGGLSFSASTGAVSANIAPGDLTAKTTPTTSDLVVIGDAASSNAVKSATIANIRKALSGSVQQIVNTETGTVATGTTTVPFDNTIPQNTEGDQYMSLAITPTNSSSTLIIDVVWHGANTVGGQLAVGLFQDSTANALAVGWVSLSAASFNSLVSFRHKMTAGTTSATTFKVRAGGNNAGTTTFNGEAGGQDYGGALASSITITEYLP